MADKEFRAFLVAKIDTLKQELANPDLAVDKLLEIATEVTRLTNRVNRMDNPVKRKPRSTQESKDAT